jgi:hypothetical protein
VVRRAGQDGYWPRARSDEGTAQIPRRPSPARIAASAIPAELASHGRCIQEISHGAGGCVTSCKSMISRPRPTIRSISPGRAAWSGKSARSVVASGLVMTWQSSNCARSVRPARPLKVISNVCDRTRSMPRSQWLTLPVSVPDGGIRVVTRYRVMRVDAMTAVDPLHAAGARRIAVKPGGCQQRSFEVIQEQRGGVKWPQVTPASGWAGASRGVELN